MSDQLLDATLRLDEDTVARLIQEMHMAETTPQSYHNEQALRYVVLMAYLSSMDHYLRFEELAGSRGYSDILFLPRKFSSKPALLFDYDGELLLVGLNYNTKNGVHTCKIERYDSSLNRKQVDI